jgi:hypothetical protein
MAITQDRKQWLNDQFGLDQIWTEATVKGVDGSIYKGHLDRFGGRTGFGTLRSPIYLYGVYDQANPLSITNWMEYMGEWRDNQPNGTGIMRRYRGDGKANIVYNGEWVNGEPVNDP